MILVILPLVTLVIGGLIGYALGLYRPTKKARRQLVETHSKLACINAEFENQLTEFKPFNTLMEQIEWQRHANNLILQERRWIHRCIAHYENLINDKNGSYGVDLFSARLIELWQHLANLEQRLARGEDHFANLVTMLEEQRERRK